MSDIIPYISSEPPSIDNDSFEENGSPVLKLSEEKDKYNEKSRISYSLFENIKPKNQLHINKDNENQNEITSDVSDTNIVEIPTCINSDSIDSSSKLESSNNDTFNINDAKDSMVNKNHIDDVDFCNSDPNYDNDLKFEEELGSDINNYVAENIPMNMNIPTSINPDCISSLKIENSNNDNFNLHDTNDCKDNKIHLNKVDFRNYPTDYDNDLKFEEEFGAEMDNYVTQINQPFTHQMYDGPPKMKYISDNQSMDVCDNPQQDTTDDFDGFQGFQSNDKEDENIIINSDCFAVNFDEFPASDNCDNDKKIEKESRTDDDKNFDLNESHTIQNIQTTEDTLSIKDENNNDDDDDDDDDDFDDFAAFEKASDIPDQTISSLNVASTACGEADIEALQISELDVNKLQELLSRTIQLFPDVKPNVEPIELINRTTLFEGENWKVWQELVNFDYSPAFQFQWMKSKVCEHFLAALGQEYTEALQSHKASLNLYNPNLAPLEPIPFQACLPASSATISQNAEVISLSSNSNLELSTTLQHQNIAGNNTRNNSSPSINSSKSIDFKSLEDEFICDNPSQSNIIISASVPYHPTRDLVPPANQQQDVFIQSSDSFNSSAIIKSFVNHQSSSSTLQTKTALNTHNNKNTAPIKLQPHQLHPASLAAINKLPDLSFMNSKVLMFPVLSSCETSEHNI